MSFPKQILQPKNFGQVAVLMGGTGAEREISLISGDAVLNALLRSGVNAIAIDIGEYPMRQLPEGKFDRVFNMIHGRGGEDGVMQGALEALGLPYTGSKVLASALTMDKLTTKLCWHGAALPTPGWCLLAVEEDLDICANRLGFPVIVKPTMEGSSIGMSKVENKERLREAWKEASGYGVVFAESWIEGSEFTVGFLGEIPLPVIRLETPNVFYDYDAKYFAETTQYHCPSGLPEDVENKLQNLAMEASRHVGVSGWGRVDILMDKEDQPWLIEINTIPGMTDHSLVPMAANAAGLNFDDLVWRILETSLPEERHGT
ncbi:MAG: D-alanine--D-alanine ligase [Methylococcales bacterium]